MDYGLDSASSYNAAGIAGLTMGFFLVFGLIILAIAIFIAISEWKVFAKAGKPGWAALVPVYGQIVMLDIIGYKWYYIFCLFLGSVPYVGGIIAILFSLTMYIKLAKAYGQSVGFGIGLTFVPIVFMPILAFKKDINYVGKTVNGDIDFNDLF